VFIDEINYLSFKISKIQILEIPDISFKFTREYGLVPESGRIEFA